MDIIKFDIQLSLEIKYYLFLSFARNIGKHTTKVTKKVWQKRE